MYMLLNITTKPIQMHPAPFSGSDNDDGDARLDYINEVLHENVLEDSRIVSGANAKGSGGFSASASGASLANNAMPEDWEEGLTFTAKPTCKCSVCIRVCSRSIFHPFHMCVPSLLSI